MKLDTYEALKRELEQLKRDYENYKLGKPEKKEPAINSDKIVAEIQSILGEKIKNLEQLITSLQLEIKEIRKNPGQPSSQLPSDYIFY